jgi:hypothetical protein
VDSGQGAALDLVVWDKAQRSSCLILLLTGGLCVCRRFLLAGSVTGGWQLWQHSTGASGSPSSIAAGAHEQRRRGGAGRKNDPWRRWKHKRHGIHLVYCGATFFFILGKLKWGTLGDSLFFPFHIYLEIWQTMRFGEKKNKKLLEMLSHFYT